VLSRPGLGPGTSWIKRLRLGVSNGVFR